MPKITAYSKLGKIIEGNGWIVESDGLSAHKIISQGEFIGELPNILIKGYKYKGWIDEIGLKITNETIVGNIDFDIFLKVIPQIRPSDYVDLLENISEKNIINTVNGKEYSTNLLEEILIGEFVIEPNTLTKVFDGTDPKYNSEIKSNFDYAIRRDALNILNDYAFARTESLSYSGYYEFNTTEVLNTNAPISCKFTINYTKSKVSELKRDNYNTKNKTAFFNNEIHFPYLGNDPENENIENYENLTLNENTYLPINNGVAIAYPVGIAVLPNLIMAIAGMHKVEVNTPSLEESCVAKIIKQTSESFTIGVWYTFRIWSAYSDEKIHLWADIGGEAYAVNSINVKVFANTIEVNESNFEYPIQPEPIRKGYELETNELMQIILGQQDETKLSYKTYKQITDAYSSDRRIITFDLINPINMLFDNSVVYDKGIIEQRYLDTNDEFSIYNEHNEYIGDFKVIQSNPAWDGSYHKIITAIMLDDSEN